MDHHYTGIAEIDVAEEWLSDFHTDGKGTLLTDESAHWVNQCVVLRSGMSGSGLGRVTEIHPEEVVIQRVPGSPRAFGVQPRDVRQTFALDLLTDPAVPCVSLMGMAGTGKTFLAEMAPDELALALDGVDAVHHSDGSRVDRDGLMSQLETIRSDGYAVSVSERLVGIVSVTAPVRDPTGSLAAVLGLTGSESELTPDVVSRLSTEVRRAASSLGSRLPRGRG